MTTKKLVRQLIEKNENEYSRLNEKYDKTSDELKEIKQQLLTVSDVLSNNIRMQNEFLEKINDEMQVLLSKSDEVSCVITQLNDSSINLSKKIVLEIIQKIHDLNNEIEHSYQSMQEEAGLIKNLVSSSAESLKNSLSFTVDENKKSLCEVISDKQNIGMTELKELRKVISENNQADEMKELKTLMDKNQIAYKRFADVVLAHENAISENIVVMNRSIKEVIRNITNLDDANRLIIAKLLLNELGE